MGKLYLHDEDDNGDGDQYVIDDNEMFTAVQKVLAQWFPEKGFVPIGAVNDVIAAIKECA